MPPRFDRPFFIDLIPFFFYILQETGSIRTPEGGTGGEPGGWAILYMHTAAGCPNHASVSLFLSVCLSVCVEMSSIHGRISEVASPGRLFDRSFPPQRARLLSEVLPQTTVSLGKYVSVLCTYLHRAKELARPASTAASHFVRGCC